jgi:pyruvate/2-oxoglutarate dehydrogenase complex dihydrolipoamide dehydrogenase (E3) component
MLPGLQPDPDLILTNIEILNLTAVPKSLAIIGAGAVGVEFASIFNRFGTEVPVFEMLPRVVPVEDEEISKELDRSFRKAGIRVETGAKVENVRKGGKGVQMTVTLAGGKTEEVEAEKLLVAVGRKPNTENIGLENTRVELDRGFIKVNPYQQTGEPGVYAIGDVVAGTPQLAHVATMEGHGGGGACRGQTGYAHQPQPHPGLHLHRAGHRQRGADGSAGPRARLPGEDRQVSVRGQQPRQHPGQPRRIHQGGGRREASARSWACTSSARRLSN